MKKVLFKRIDIQLDGIMLTFKQKFTHALQPLAEEKQDKKYKVSLFNFFYYS